MSKAIKVCIISISTLVLILVLLLTLVFTIKDVKANLLITSASNTLTNESVMTELKSQDVLPYNQSVFFLNRNKVTADIEKTIPKIKVVNLEITFPNAININYTERVPVFAVKISNSTYSYAIVDEDFKVISLSMTDADYINFSFTELQKNDESQLVKKEISFDNLRAGDFMCHNYLKELKAFFSLLKQYKTTESALIKIYENIEVYMRHTLENDHLSIKFKTIKGYNVDIYNFSNDTDRKVKQLLSIVSNSEITANQIIGD